jgi:glucose/mannose-6-phosphate isomerase
MLESLIKKYDPSDMRRLLRKFPDQVEEAVGIGKKFRISAEYSRVNKIVVTGLGGSAIGGDLLRAFTSDTLKIPFYVVRHYFLPEFVDRDTLVIASSYSGDTEETVAIHADAMRRGAKIVCMSSGGEISRLAKMHKQPLIVIPKGFPPRTALGYSFFPLLVLLRKLRCIPTPVCEIDETLPLLRRLSKTYDHAGDKNNLPVSIAKRLKGKLPIIYSAADRFDVVNVRWRGQIAENAKVLAFGHVYPEMNHNEMVGWSKPFHSGEVIAAEMKKMAVVFLRDKEDHPRVRLRMDITKEIIRKSAGDIIELDSQGESLLARMFSLIHLGDWVSYYLAMLNHVDPTPVKVIDFVKNELSKK